MKLIIPHTFQEVDIIFVLSKSTHRFEYVLSAYGYNNFPEYYINGFKMYNSQGVIYIKNGDLIDYINEA